MIRRSFVAPALAALTALAAPACSSSPTGGGETGDPAVARYAFDFTTAPGEETHYCQYMKMPEGEGSEVLVTGYTWSWKDMHHWALYRTTSDLPADVSLTEPFDCFAPGAMKYAAPASLELGGSAEGDQSFPEGTGFSFKPGEIVMFQAHTLNTGNADVHPHIDLSVKLGDPAKVKDRLGLIQFYDPYIYVPAHGKAQAQMRCAVPRDITVVQATTHQHTRGKGVSVFLDEPGSAPAASPFLQSTDWEHPVTDDTVMKIQKGSFIRTVCDYQGGDHDVFQGQNKQDNEMCMYVGYYYPAIPVAEDGGGFENCVQTPVPGGVGDSYGTGDKSCADSLACIQSCSPADAPVPGDGRIDVGACWQKCLVDSCPGASAPLNALGYCVGQKCQAECAGGNCAACVISKCSKEYGACQSQGC
ncbi:MAG: hypothetical protein U0359_10060 [Byssovorax sp.]